ncbi:MAG: hypothetical protein A2172_04825 [Candidatus Woykebacteria bacterium RBG_13_40_15]|uniref:Thioredoxin domain-containing protein n=1 Tax=Candidatus Woykebacteria bacterium RBG_13_40_15 TaxID=1802593 RepID=A0A1G1W7D9_9BACT|nr:MAG: hypothetical protein A2172_04825 [Candidatus Woykebacteria bacterium RBG_13_40_15]
MLGAKDAKVTIVEFSDFQCSHCARVYSVISQVLDSYEESQVRFVFRNFPLGGNQYSIDAAVAAEAAGKQGKYWDYCGLIYENQTKLDRESLISYAKELDLNIDEFEKAMESKTSKDAVLMDVSDGEKLGVAATPTFFINGVKHEGALSFDQFKEIIDSELKK